MNFDVNQLRSFDEVMQTRNFRAAAQIMGIPQSSLSLQISRLEEELGHRLFARTTRRVEPTPEGRALLAYAHAILALAEDTRRHFERPSRDGMLKLGIVEDFALGELHLVLGLFRRQFPRFALTLTTSVSARLFRYLDEGAIDLVLAKRQPGRTQGRRLCERKLVWCGMASEVPNDPSTPVPVVTCVDESGMRAAVTRSLRATGRPFLVAAESDGLAGIVAAVAAGFGLTAFCDGFVPSSVSRLGPEHDLPSLGTIEYVIEHRDHLEEAVEAFVALLEKLAHALGTLDQQP